MNNLKTLKELRKPVLEIIKLVRKRQSSLPPELSFCNALEDYFKQEDTEAVKDYKHYDKLEKTMPHPEEIRELICGAVKDYIKWKNNLTEEDLKEVGE